MAVASIVSIIILQSYSFFDYLKRLLIIPIRRPAIIHERLSASLFVQAIKSFLVHIVRLEHMGSIRLLLVYSQYSIKRDNPCLVLNARHMTKMLEECGHVLASVSDISLGVCAAASLETPRNLCHHQQLYQPVFVLSATA